MWGVLQCSEIGQMADIGHAWRVVERDCLRIPATPDRDR
jgi:hypothetical protein